jgi:hypothetical protein
VIVGFKKVLTIEAPPFFFFFLVSMGWGETESTWYCGHYWPIIPAPNVR